MAPEEIIKILNRRGDMKVFHTWMKRSARFQIAKELWMELCGTIIDLWLQSYETLTPFPNDIAREVLDRLDYE